MARTDALAETEESNTKRRGDLHEPVGAGYD